VIVDRKPLVEQWRDRLVTHLGVSAREIGRLESGRDRQKGKVDLATAQSLARREDLGEVTASYGLVVVDECHHVPAVSFERCVRQIPVRRWLGLTATPYRRDGLQALISMYCGEIRHTISSDASSDALSLALHVHTTKFAVEDPSGVSIQQLFKCIVEDEERTRQICADVADAVRRGRNCLVLTQWSEHLVRIEALLRERGIAPHVLRGGIGKKAHGSIVAELASALPGDGVAVVATGSYLGEGFDCPPLDTVFLAFPIAFKGRVVQYVGRVVRLAEGKDSVEVHDYVDVDVPVLERMHAKRLLVFTSLGLRRS
jgi:superfamily II DNA or RNA helicase